MRIGIVCLITGFLLSILAAQGQSYQFRASVDRPQQPGYQRILLPPNVVGHLNDNLTDIRLYDGKQQEVPYQLMQESPTRTATFIDYEIVRREIKPGASTTLVLRNRAKSQIRSLVIAVKNTNVGKKASLSGSSDAQNWYAIQEDIWLEPTSDNSKTTDIKSISFPLSDYEYYRFAINDSASAPINILRVGYYAPKPSAGRYTLIEGVLFSQRDSSDRHTYVHLTRPTNARFDRLALMINHPTAFRRQAAISQLRTRKHKRRRVETWLEPLHTFELSSQDSILVDLPSVKANDLYLVIDNDDNPPLKVSQIRAYQLSTYLVANLTTNSSYELRFANTNEKAPVYDLTDFNRLQPDKLPTLHIQDIRSITPKDTTTSSFLTNAWVIWPALGLVLLVVGLLSYRMLTEMGQSG